MRVWVDLANSPHVALLAPVVRQLRQRGDEVVITARDHAQTVELARLHGLNLLVVGGASPAGRSAKGLAVIGRARALLRFARRHRPDVAFSHGSYAQILASRMAGVPAVTMMDYEHQPANHLSFRLARRVIVPEVFPEGSLRRLGAAPRKVVRYPGFKEELYLADFHPDPAVLNGLGLDGERVIAVLRPPPEGALYHRMANERFEQILRHACEQKDVQVVLLPRTAEQRSRYGERTGLRVPSGAIDGSSLLALADITIGAGGTMNRESAMLGTPTYTVFQGRLAAVDAELMRQNRLTDLRGSESMPRFEKKGPQTSASAPNAAAIMERIVTVIADLGEGSR